MRLSPKIILILTLSSLAVVLCFFAVRGRQCSRIPADNRPVKSALHGQVAPLVLLPPDPDTAQLLTEANAFKAQKQFTDAVESYQKAIARSPAHPQAYFELGALYFQQGMKEQSEASYLKAIELNYNNPEIYFHVGYIKESSGKLQDALEWYLRAEEKGVGSAELYFNIGNVLAQLGNNIRALEYYVKAVSVNPGHVDAFVNLSIISFQEKKYADAEFYLAKAQALGYNAPEDFLKALAIEQLKAK